MVTVCNSPKPLISKNNENLYLSIESLPESQSKLNSAKTPLNPLSQLNFASNLSTTINMNTKTDLFYSITPLHSIEINKQQHLNNKKTLQFTRTNNYKLRNFLLSCRFKDIEPEMFNRNTHKLEIKHKFVQSVAKYINLQNSSTNLFSVKMNDLINISIPDKSNYNHYKKRLSNSENMLYLDKEMGRCPFSEMKSNYSVLNKDISSSTIHSNTIISKSNSFLFKTKINNNLNQKNKLLQSTTNPLLKKNLILKNNNSNKEIEVNDSEKQLQRMSNFKNIKKRYNRKQKQLLLFLENKLKDKLNIIKYKSQNLISKLKAKYSNKTQTNLYLKKYRIKSYYFHENNKTNLFNENEFYVISLSANKIQYEPQNNCDCVLSKPLIKKLLNYLQISNLSISELLFSSHTSKEAASTKFQKNKSSCNVTLGISSRDTKNIIFFQNFFFHDYLENNISKNNHKNNNTTSEHRTLFNNNYHRSNTQKNKYNKQITLHYYTRFNLLNNSKFFIRKKSKHTRDFGDIMQKSTKEIIDDINYLIHFNQRLNDTKNKINYFIFQLLKRFINLSEVNKFKTYHFNYGNYFILNTIDNEGNTLLILAVKMNLKDIVEYLLMKGINADIQNVSSLLYNFRL